MKLCSLMMLSTMNGGILILSSFKTKAYVVLELQFLMYPGTGYYPDSKVENSDLI